MDKLNATMSTIRGPALEPRQPSSSRGEAPVDGRAFRDTLSALQMPQGPTPNASTAAAQGLKFSNHAVDRMRARGIKFSPDEMTRIQSAVSKAASKGSKDSLLITDNAALIVSVKDKTVVTVMDKASLKDNVFTNIDSTVMI